MSRGDITRMPASTTTQTADYVVGVVIDVKDPDQMGRVKIRGMDQKNITDDKLNWSHASKGGNQSYGGMGSGAHGYKPGMLVKMSVPSTDQQSAEILGPYHQPGATGQAGNQMFQDPLMGKPESGGGEGRGGQKDNPYEERHKTVNIDDVTNASGAGPMAGGFDKGPKTAFNTQRDPFENFYKPEESDKNNKPAKFADLPTIAFQSTQQS